MKDLEAQANARGLTVAGRFHPDPEDGLPAGTQTVLLLAPRGAAFWKTFTASDFFRDGEPDPIDRWSRHVIGKWACDLGAKALFPFGGPPHLPFENWALKTGRAFRSPVGFLVHTEQGLMVSFRGALALRQRVDSPLAAARPCDTCDAPCVSACPVSALTETDYDVAACKTFLADDPACMREGCAVRRACPVSQTFDRPAAQSAFHMRAFR